MRIAELDEGVIDAARKYFNVNESDNYRIIVNDGRVYLMRNRDKHDIIMVDVFRADSYIPFHLLTEEFYRLAKTRLSKGGCLVMNMHNSTRLFDSSLLTIRGVFDSVDTYLVRANVIVVTHDSPDVTKQELRNKARLLQDKYGSYHDIRDLLSKKHNPVIGRNARRLTDDFAPVNMYLTIEVHNRKRR